MLKAKELSTVNLILFLALSLAAAAGVFMARPQQIASQSSLLFMGQEVIVRPAEKAAPVSRVITAVKPVTAVNTVQPVAPVVLPIIPPTIMAEVLPQYPSSALEQSLSGTVILSVFVGLGGQAEKIETKLSSGIAELDEAAVKALAQWRFASATQGGSALASWLEIPVRFEIK